MSVDYEQTDQQPQATAEDDDVADAESEEEPQRCLMDEGAEIHLSVCL